MKLIYWAPESSLPKKLTAIPLQAGVTVKTLEEYLLRLSKRVTDRAREDGELEWMAEMMEERGLTDNANLVTENPHDLLNRMVNPEMFEKTIMSDLEWEVKLPAGPIHKNDPEAQSAVEETEAMEWLDQLDLQTSQAR